MIDANPVPNDTAINAPLDNADTVFMGPPAQPVTTTAGFHRVHVEQFCDECRGTGVIGSNKAPCFTCNGLGYNRVAVDVPVEEDS